MSRKTDLASTVHDYAKLNAQIDELKEQQKALADRAWLAGLVQAGSEANARKAVAQLAKELDWETDKREAQAQLELALDQGRLTLGISADLSKMRDDIRRGEVDIKAGDAPWMSEQLSGKA